MKSESEKHYSNIIKDFDPDMPRKRKSIDDVKDKLYTLLIAGYSLKEISNVVGYNMVTISSYCVKTWGGDYQRKLKKKGLI